MYAVVTLLESNELMVVPSEWLSSDKRHCSWPPFKSPETCKEAVQNKLNPETEGKPWEKLRIIFLGEYGTFEKAKEGQKEFKEHKERSLDMESSATKRQRLENTQGIPNNQLQPLPPVTSASPSRMSADDKVEILQMLRDIKSNIQQNSTMLKKILSNNTVSEAPSSTSVPLKGIKANLKLPIRTLDDVNTTETELKNATTRKKYVKYLSGLGGVVPKDVIKNIMQQVLTDDLAMHFNWQGRGDKQAFSQLTLADVIRDAALKRKVIKGDCETEIKKYLSYAAARKKPKEQGGPGHEISNVISTSMDN
ncbi:hypothetical protein QQF64_013264 [Cirrhinus molitorella]|uniref:DUF4806 domain-containing protein n=1 Tax=Cirrhinus molitorella TaxID=172907 RepID=A0ABR3LQL7_9TELE